MLKILWTAKLTNEEVLNYVNVDRDLLVTVKRGKLLFWDTP